jgi:O-acetylserine/cysteine efflux transporter
MTNSRRLVFPALVAAGLLWGTTVPLSKVALGWLSPAWLTCARFALAAVVLMLVSRTRLRAASRPAIAATGAVGYGGAILLQNMGVERTSVTHAALLIGAVPVLVAVMAGVLRHSVARPVAWAGFALSMAGVAVIAGGQGAGSSLGGDGLVLAAQLLSAAFTVSQARMLPGRDPVAVTAVQLMAAAVAVLPVALVTGGLPAAPAATGPLFATVGLVLAGTVLPTALFAFGQSRVTADVAGAFVNLEPLVGAALGTVAFGDPLSAVQAAGGLAVLAGVALSSVPVVRGIRVSRPSVPEVGVPEVGVPEVGVPEVGVPEVGVPEVGVPEVGVPALAEVPGPHDTRSAAALLPQPRDGNAATSGTAVGNLARRARPLASSRLSFRARQRHAGTADANRRRRAARPSSRPASARIARARRRLAGPS